MNKYINFRRMKHLLLVTSFWLVSLSSFSQKVLHSKEFSDPLLSGRVYVMLREGVQMDTTALQNMFGNLLKDYGFRSFEKRFPNVKSPRKKTTAAGERLADISRIYRIRLEEDAPIQPVLALLRKNRLVQFAEPHFLPAPCYVPNDDSIQIQYALSRVNAFAAWDIQKGDTTVLIGITDTGYEPFHPDLNANIQHNWADPLNGIDDDQDGYIDNYMGWDTGSDDNNPAVDDSYHGIHVTGLCCAVTDNQIGMAGTGFNSRFIHIKIANTEGVLTGAYEGLIYAADHGCKVINCSWGGNQYSDINQELIRYAAVNKNCVVTCGAGNNNNEQLFYPASYPYALSVASTDINDSKPEFSNYGYAIDLVAPGDYVLSTWVNGTYVRSGGTSMSAPIVAGAAALLRASFPDWNSRQVVEQLKVSADQIDTLPLNTIWKDKLGAGRLNMLRALSQSGVPAVVLSDIQASSSGGGSFLPGDTVNLSGLLINYLAPASSVNLVLSSESNAVKFINPERQMGAMESLASISLADDPFLIEIAPNAGINQTVVLQLQIESGNFIRNQYIYLTIFSDIINVETSVIRASFGSDGSVGSAGSGFLKGNGFRYKNGAQLLYEGGLMIGGVGRGVVDNIRGSGGDINELFTESVLTRKSIPMAGIEEYRGSFRSDDPLLNIHVDQRVILSEAIDQQNFILSEYHLVNQSMEPYEGLYAGIFCDWDLADPGANRAGWNSARRLGYVYTVPTDTLYTGTQILGTVPLNFYAIDNIPGGAGGLNLADGFTDEEKYLALSTSRNSAGASPGGSDIVTVLSGGPFDLNPGEDIRLAFAFHANASIQALNQSAAIATYFYQQTVLPLGSGSVEKKPEIKIFPNPASRQFSIFISGDLSGQTPELVDIQGRLVGAFFEKIPKGWKVQLTENTAGLIFLRRMTADGWQYERVLIRGTE